MSRVGIKSRQKAVIVIETDSDNYLATSSGRKAFWSAFCTFNLAVMGSSVLPMPYALSHTGAAVGLLTMLLVALCNDYTTVLMITAAYETGYDSFESLALWAGGPHWKLFTQVTLIALLWGPNSGGLSLMGDVAQVMCDRAFGSHAAAAPGADALGPSSAAAAPSLTQPAGWQEAFTAHWMGPESFSWLANGQTLMVVMTVLVVFPLSCQRHMRSLESAAAAGLVVVAGLCCFLAYRALREGLPAVADGQFALWSFKVTDDLPEAFSLLGFAFYLQPLMMPILREMPEGNTGRRALTAAVHSSLLGSSLLLYAGTGFFGAALFGSSTAGNVMLNSLTDSTAGTMVMYSCMLLYLAAGAAACQYPLRTSIDLLLVGEHVPMTTARSVVINAVTLAVSLSIALITPGGAEKVYAVVGASGVCIVCYVLPVCIHLKLLQARRRAKRQLSDSGVPDVEQLAAPLLLSSPHSSASSLINLAVASSSSGSSGSGSGSSIALPGRPYHSWSAWLQSAAIVMLPLSVMCVGIGFSVAAMWVAVSNIMRGDR